MIIQAYKIECENCSHEIVSRVGDMTGTSEIIVEFLDGLEFECEECGTTHYLEVDIVTA